MCSRIDLTYYEFKNVCLSVFVAKWLQHLPLDAWSTATDASRWRSLLHVLPLSPQFPVCLSLFLLMMREFFNSRTHLTNNESPTQSDPQTANFIYLSQPSHCLFLTFFWLSQQHCQWKPLFSFWHKKNKKKCKQKLWIPNLVGEVSTLLRQLIWDERVQTVPIMLWGCKQEICRHGVSESTVGSTLSPVLCLHLFTVWKCASWKVMLN